MCFCLFWTGGCVSVALKRLTLWRAVARTRDAVITSRAVTWPSLNKLCTRLRLKHTAFTACWRAC